MSSDNVEFIHIPRTGGTTILTHLKELDPVKFDVDRFHVTANQLYALDANFTKKYSFAIVRNPYQRLVSMWQYELKRALGSKNPDFAKFNDFNVWLKYHVASLDWGRSFTILPQWFWISDWGSEELLVSEVFFYEMFDDCLTKLGNILNKEFDKTLITNRSMKHYDYKEIATEESKRIMIELCYVDTKHFGYRW